MARERPPLPDDGLYRTILWVIVLTIVAGAIVTIGGQTVWQDPEISNFGAIVALVGGALYVVFRWLGMREAKRRAGEDDPDHG